MPMSVSFPGKKSREFVMSIEIFINVVVVFLINEFEPKIVFYYETPVPVIIDV